jgi:hypothetical protein
MTTSRWVGLHGISDFSSLIVSFDTGSMSVRRVLSVCNTRPMLSDVFQTRTGADMTQLLQKRQRLEHVKTVHFKTSEGLSLRPSYSSI